MSAATSVKRSIVLRYGQWLVLALAAALRFFNLGFPRALVFDETYYVKDAWTLSQLGYESSWPDMANEQFVSGEVNVFNTDPSFVVHPPLGKWLIALGQNLFGAENAFSWRVTVALAGVLAVWLVIAVARRLLHSQGWALVAGLFMAIDGMAIVMSRTAILDNFVMFFALLAFYCLLRDRDQIASKLSRRALELQGGADPVELRFAGVFVARPWLVACAVALGATTAVKWSGLYFAVAFGLYVVLSEALTRRRLGFKGWAAEGYVGQTVANLALMVPVYLATYLFSWTGWLLTRDGWSRGWALDPENHLPGLLGMLPNWAQSLIHYHDEMYGFHVNLKTPHGYQSNPFTWLFNIRPVSFFYEGQDAGTNGCGPAYNCSEAITALGNPLIWWGAAGAVILVLYRYLVAIGKFIDPRGAEFRKPLPEEHRTEGLLLLGLVAGYVPWLFYTERTIFHFYSIAFLPWTILSLTYVLKRISESRPGARHGVRVFIWICIGLSIFFSNVWLGYQTPYWYWLIHMWLPSWI